MASAQRSQYLTATQPTSDTVSPRPAGLLVNNQYGGLDLTASRRGIKTSFTTTTRRPLACTPQPDVNDRLKYAPKPENPGRNSVKRFYSRKLGRTVSIAAARHNLGVCDRIDYVNYSRAAAE